MDPQKALEMMRPKSVSDDEVDAFVNKIDAVTVAMEEIKKGTFDPANCKIPGYRTPEQQEREEEEHKQKELERKKREDERKMKLKDEERERWWDRARMRASGSVKEDEDEMNRIVPSCKAKDANDYSVWDRWEPHDPATLEEEKEKEDHRLKTENEAFERSNPDFCDQFKKDLTKRERSELEKQKSAQKWKAEGNAFYKRKQYTQAIHMYTKALRDTPFTAGILFNVALCHFRLDQMDDCVEFSSRAIFVDPQHVKALSRRAAAKYKQNRLKEAVDDLKDAVRIEASNPDLQEQYSNIVGEYEDTTLHEKLMEKYDLQESETKEACTDTLTDLQQATSSGVLSLKRLVKLIHDHTDNADDLRKAYERIKKILCHDDDVRVWFRTSNNMIQLCQNVVENLEALSHDLVSREPIGVDGRAGICSSSLDVLEACCRQSPRNQLVLFQQVPFREALKGFLVSWCGENCVSKCVMSALCFLDTVIDLQAWKKDLTRSPKILTCFLSLLEKSDSQVYGYISSLCFTVSDTAQGIQAIVGLPELTYMTAIFACGANIKASAILRESQRTNTMLNLLGFLVNVTTNLHIQSRLSRQSEENKVLVTQLLAMSNIGASNAVGCLDNAAWSTLLERVFAVLLNLTFQDDSSCRESFMIENGTAPVTQLISFSAAQELDWVLKHANLISYCVSLLCRHHPCAEKYTQYSAICFQTLDPLVQLHHQISPRINSNDPNSDGMVCQLLAHVWCHIGWIIKQQSQLSARLLDHKDIVPSVVSILHHYVESKSDLNRQSNSTFERLIGNIIAALITLVSRTETSGTTHSILSTTFTLEILVNILQHLTNGFARKNVAVLLAKLCQHSPQVKDQVRGMRGLEMMLSIYQNDGFQM
uniref:Uncharacterized protein AlNc14C32G2959 n=1 Tax=Albugo laibachii Nc14 TaxID=890382 RepID=F0W809_9STRA|nr:conserved hypothetical protein [Albugo laibachii Nc14]|eukprot:CCA17262.1 conserved hypothetical protein [Albugo laibachii Nc14]